MAELEFQTLSLDTDETILKPLRFENEPTNSEISSSCMLCDASYDIETNRDEFLAHLFREHRLVIADVDLIANLREYVTYWKYRFSQNPLEEFCTTMLLDKKPNGEYSVNEKYYLLSDVVEEDRTLRREIHNKQLEKVLQQQTDERNDETFTRDCWFCHLNYKGSRVGYLKHLSESHNVQLGRPDKLVYITDLLNHVDILLNSLKCLYCKKTFKDRQTLKEHMRKKQHKLINPNDHTFDRYYIVNYVEIGKNWKQFQEEKEMARHRAQRFDDASDGDDENWDGWEEKLECNMHCFFCPHSEMEFTRILQHMRTGHDFDFDRITSSMVFYDKIKLVNYVRRQVFLNMCIYCGEKFVSNGDLLEHAQVMEHFKVPDEKVWNHVTYFFPTYEDDAILFQLDEAGDDDFATVQCHADYLKRTVGGNNRND